MSDRTEGGATLDPRVLRLLRWLVGTVAAGTILIAGLVLGGYALRIPVLTTLHRDLKAMSVLTAGGLGLLAAGMIAELVDRQRIAKVLSGSVLILAGSAFLSHSLYGADLLSGRLAEFMFQYPAEIAGRTSLATASCLALIAGAVLALRPSRVGHLSLSELCAALSMLVSGVAVVCYAYGLEDLYALAPFNTIALHTSVALLLLSMSALFLKPESGWAAVVASSLNGGSATRRQLLFTLLIPLTGGLLLKATRAESIGPSLAMALLVMLTVASLWVLILRDGRALNAADEERRIRGELLARAKADVDAQLAERIAALDAETQERLRIEDALRQSQKLEAIGQLTGGVAHDFNNLLTVIRSSVDLLARPDLPEDRRKRYIGAISDTVTRAAKLTGQLLAFARRQALKPETFDVGQAVSVMGDMMGTLTGSRIRIISHIPPFPCFISADPSQFDTAAINMAVNARDAMGGEGDLTITVEPALVIPPVRRHPAIEGDFVAVRIADTGSGIAPELLERIFEPFFTTKAIGMGTGLGLSQVFGFAKQSGGDVDVTSEIGKGSTFTLYLPRVVADVQAIEAEPLPLVDGHGTCVLLVEDNTEVGTFSSQALEELGYTTVWASSAEAALQELAQDADRFDIVFTDVVMPGMNGIDLAQEVRRMHHDLPVVLASGYSHVLAQNGTYGFELLHKPYSVEQLSRILRKAANWQRRARLLNG